MPKRPKFKLPGSPIKPFREALSKTHERIAGARSDIRSVADDLHSFRTLGREPTLEAPESPPTAPPAAESKPAYSVSDKDTLLYQLDHLVAYLKRLETHLSEGCRIMGTPCDCCGKHALEARVYAVETIPIAARIGKETSVYQKISDWAIGIEEMETPEKIESGEYDEAYRKESGTASNFRKKVQSMIAELKKEDDCPSCEEMRGTISEFIERRKRERGEV